MASEILEIVHDKTKLLKLATEAYSCTSLTDTLDQLEERLTETVRESIPTLSQSVQKLNEGYLIALNQRNRAKSLLETIKNQNLNASLKPLLDLSRMYKNIRQLDLTLKLLKATHHNVIHLKHHISTRSYKEALAILNQSKELCEPLNGVKVAQQFSDILTLDACRTDFAEMLEKSIFDISESFPAYDTKLASPTSKYEEPNFSTVVDVLEYFDPGLTCGLDQAANLHKCATKSLFQRIRSFHQSQALELAVETAKVIVELNSRSQTQAAQLTREKTDNWVVQKFRISLLDVLLTEYNNLLRDIWNNIVVLQPQDLSLDLVVDVLRQSGHSLQPLGEIPKTFTVSTTTLYQSALDELFKKYEMDSVYSLCVGLEQDNWDEIPHSSSSALLLKLIREYFIAKLESVPHCTRIVARKITNVLAYYRVGAFEVMMTSSGTNSLRNTLIQSQRDCPPNYQPVNLKPSHLTNYAANLTNLLEELPLFSEAIHTRRISGVEVYETLDESWTLQHQYEPEMAALRAALVADINIAFKKLTSVLVKALNVKGWVSQAEDSHSECPWDLPKWMNGQKDKPVSTVIALFGRRFVSFFKIMHYKKIPLSKVSQLCKDAWDEIILLTKKLAPFAATPIPIFDLLLDSTALYYLVPSEGAVVSGYASLPLYCPISLCQLESDWKDFVTRLLCAVVKSRCDIISVAELPPVLITVATELFPSCPLPLPRSISQPDLSKLQEPPTPERPGRSDFSPQPAAKLYNEESEYRIAYQPSNRHSVSDTIISQCQETNYSLSPDFGVPGSKTPPINDSPVVEQHDGTTGGEKDYTDFTIPLSQPPTPGVVVPSEITNSATVERELPR